MKPQSTKRFHVHIAVDDLAANIRFYSGLFGVAPTIEKSDYAKWMLDDPRVNFAISARGGAAGLNHLGLQVDSDDELGELRARADAANVAVLEQKATACCYARSDKHWVQDPQGIAWEAFHTLGDVPVFGEPAARGAESEAAGCCVPETSAPRSACCG